MLVWLTAKDNESKNFNLSNKYRFAQKKRRKKKKKEKERNPMPNHTQNPGSPRYCYSKRSAGFAYVNHDVDKKDAVGWLRMVYDRFSGAVKGKCDIRVHM